MQSLRIALIGLAVLLTGCATTNTPEDLGALEYTGFNTKADKSAFQSVMGLNCPSDIDGIPLLRTNVYNDAGTDVSCTYSSEGRLLTVYLSRFRGDSLGTYFESSRLGTESVILPKGFVYDEELSEVCSAQSIDSTAILSGFEGILSGENTSNEITLTTTPSAVYLHAADGMASVLVVDEMFEGNFFKTRYTGPNIFSGQSTEGIEQICTLIRDNYLEMRTSVRKARGLETSKSDTLRELINSAGEDS